MSMNLHVEAVAKAVVTSTGKEITVINRFDLWQTPTKVTRSCLKSENPEKAYQEWVRSVSKDEEIPAYAEDDFWQEKDPVGFKIVNYGEDHLKELSDWIAEQTDQGFEIEWYEL